MFRIKGSKGTQFSHTFDCRFCWFKGACAIWFRGQVRTKCLNHLSIEYQWSSLFIMPFHVFQHVYVPYKCPLYSHYIPLIWVNYNNSPTWNKAIWGWFPLLTMIPVRSQWGRYNLPRLIYILSYYFCWLNPHLDWKMFAISMLERHLLRAEWKRG